MLAQPSKRMNPRMSGSRTTEVSVLYGDSQQGCLQFAGPVRVDMLSPALAVTDVSRMVAKALGKPLDFPSVEQAIVPGDRVVLAVDPSVPQLPQVLEAVLSYFEQQGIPSEQFTVVLAAHEQADITSLARVLPDDCAIEVHDADDQTKVAYVAANTAGDPIYMNRSMVDADVVIPIMCARGQTAIDYHGAFGVFPLLTDRKTRGQFFNLRQLSDPSDHQRLTAWADEAAWWGGVLVAMQVIPGLDGGIVEILAGSPQPLEKVVQARLAEVWQVSVEQTYDAVIALVDGGPSQQSWDSLARVLATVSPLLRPDGALIVCTQLAHRPGPALRKLRQVDRGRGAVTRALASENSDDALAAAVLLESLATCHIYLLSDLPSEIVEALGLVAVESLQQVEHVIQERKQCLVLGSAQHRMVRNANLA